MASSLSDRVYAGLKSRINSLSVLPGSPLGEAELAQAFRTSRTPVREALRRLHAEGLVTLIPRRGAVVGGTSFREIIDAYEVREILEPFGALRAAERGLNLKVLNGLRQRLMRLNDVEPLSSGDVNERKSVDRALHSAIARASGNDALTKVIEEMHSRVLRALGLIGRGGRFRTSRVEHLEILKAIQMRDGKRAHELMSQHLRLSKEWLLGRGILNSSGPNVDIEVVRVEMKTLTAQRREATTSDGTAEVGDDG